MPKYDNGLKISQAISPLAQIAACEDGDTSQEDIKRLYLYHELPDDKVITAEMPVTP